VLEVREPGGGPGGLGPALQLDDPGPLRIQRRPVRLGAHEFPFASGEFLLGPRVGIHVLLDGVEVGLRGGRSLRRQRGLPLVRLVRSRGRARPEREVAAVLRLDGLQQRLPVRSRGAGLPGRAVEGIPEGRAPAQVLLHERRGLEEAQRLPQVRVRGLLEDPGHPVVCRHPHELFHPGRGDPQFGGGLPEPLLPVREPVGPAGDLRLDRGGNVLPHGPDGLHLPLPRGVLLLQQQVERLQHGGLPDLVRALEHDHAGVRERNLALLDALVVGEDEAVELHRAPPETRR